MDSFITVLARSGDGQLETPKCSLKNDGTEELNFSFPMYIREKEELVENPIWYSYNDGLLIENMRKLKLIFNKGEEYERVIEFLITKITETHTQGTLMCEVEAEGLIFHELVLVKLILRRSMRIGGIQKLEKEKIIRLKKQKIMLCQFKIFNFGRIEFLKVVIGHMK